MMIARAKWRAVSGKTAFSIAPSRKCRCQSSGRRSVRLWSGFSVMGQSASASGGSFPARNRQSQHLSCAAIEQHPGFSVRKVPCVLWTDQPHVIRHKRSPFGRPRRHAQTLAKSLPRRQKSHRFAPSLTADQPLSPAPPAVKGNALTAVHGNAARGGSMPPRAARPRLRVSFFLTFLARLSKHAHGHCIPHHRPERCRGQLARA